ncbi:MAG TPA: hemerythrin domain-containing protein [Actinocatenispora sp.]
MPRLDLTVYLAAHRALRRDAELVTAIAATGDDDAWRILRTAVGWEQFTTAAELHWRAGDEVLWPALRVSAAGRPDDLALLAAMEAEHGLVSQRVAAVEDALFDREYGIRSAGVLVDRLAEALSAHLRREEDEALPLVRELVTEPQWALFCRRLMGPDTGRMLPWLLDGADHDEAAALLATLPDQTRAAYAADWLPAYAALDRWGT